MHLHLERIVKSTLAPCHFWAENGEVYYTGLECEGSPDYNFIEQLSPDELEITDANYLIKDSITLKIKNKEDLITNDYLRQH